VHFGSPGKADGFGLHALEASAEAEVFALDAGALILKPINIHSL
jgi:hypothetical protein